MKYIVKHAITGRVRLFFPYLDAPRTWLSWAATELGKSPGVRQVTTNALCSSLTVLYDPEVIDANQLLSHLGNIDENESATPLAGVPEQVEGHWWNDSYWNPWNLAGSFFVGLGIVGIILPVVPTVPFLLVAVWCYLKASGRFYDWLMNQPVLGGYLREYKEGQGFSPDKKRKALIFTWLLSGITIIFSESLLTIAATLAGATVGTIIILRVKTIEEEAGSPP